MYLIPQHPVIIKTNIKLNKISPRKPKGEITLY